MAWTDYVDDVGTGALSGAATGATIGSVVPVVGTTAGAIAGGVIGGVSGWFSERERQNQMGSMGDLQGIDPELERLRISPHYQSLFQSTLDPAYNQIMTSDAYNSLLSGGVDPAFADVIAAQNDPGFQAMLRGEIDPAYNNALTRSVSGHFAKQRNQLAASLANSGVLSSSAGGRLLADTYNSERDALTNALAGNQLQRMSLAHGLLGSRASAIAGNRLSRLALGYNTAGQIANNRLSRGALANQHASTMAANRLNRQGLHADIMAERNAQRTAAGAGTAELFGNILDYNLAQDQLAAERNKGMTQYLPGQIGPQAPAQKRSPIFPTVSQKPTQSKIGALRNTWNANRSNPSTGSGGMRRFLAPSKTQALKLPGSM